MKTAVSPQQLQEENERLYRANQSLIHQNQALQREQAQEICTLNEEKQHLKSEIERLNHIVALFKSRQFGKKTEKALPEQGCLFDEPTEVESEQPNETQDKITVSYTRPKTNKRSKLDENLPREQVVHDLKEEEKVCGCGHELHKIGDDISEQVDIIPATIKVIQHIRPKYACRACEDGIQTTPMPKQPIPKSLATPGTLAFVLVSKYCDHIPLHRLENIFKRIGIDIPKSTACEWALRCGELLEPLVALLKAQILSGDYVKADETPVKILNQKEKDSHNAYMWVYRTGPPKGKQGIVFEYHPTRSGAVAESLFSNFKGYLQTDAYAGYNRVLKNQDVIELGCMAHARRRFAEIVKLSKKPGAAQIAVNFIAKLYAIESEARKKNLNSEQVRNLRVQKAKPILDKFKTWLDKTKPRTLAKSALGEAVSYALNHWQALTNYLRDGRLEIDNNSIERAIRPFKLGAKNWLFLGNERGAKAAANIYSLIETCKANDAEPYNYLRHALAEIPKAQSRADLLNLLP